MLDNLAEDLYNLIFRVEIAGVEICADALGAVVECFDEGLSFYLVAVDADDCSVHLYNLARHGSAEC